MTKFRRKVREFSTVETEKIVKTLLPRQVSPVTLHVGVVCSECHQGVRQHFNEEEA